MVAGQRRERAGIGFDAYDVGVREPAAEPQRGLAGVCAKVDDELRIAMPRGLVLSLAEDLLERNEFAHVAKPEPSASRRQIHAHWQRHLWGNATLDRQQMNHCRREE